MTETKEKMKVLLKNYADTQKSEVNNCDNLNDIKEENLQLV